MADYHHVPESNEDAIIKLADAMRAFDGSSKPFLPPHPGYWVSDPVITRKLTLLEMRNGPLVDAIQKFKFGTPHEDFESMILTSPSMFSLATMPSPYQCVM